MKQCLDAKSADGIISEQGKDGKISVVIDWKAESNERPNWEHVSHLDADYKTYWSQWNRLVVKDSFTAAGVVPCGGRKTSPRTSTIVQFIYYFGPLRSAIIF